MIEHYPAEALADVPTSDHFPEVMAVSRNIMETSRHASKFKLESLAEENWTERGRQLETILRDTFSQQARGGEE